MGKTEIIAELPNLKAEERSQVFQKLCELQDADLVNGIGPSAHERQLLDDAWAEFQRDGDLGIPWREALQRIRSTNTK